MVTVWARRDVISFWIGRTVSPKPSFNRVRDSLSIGTIVEVGRAGWVGILWEDGTYDGHWNRRELDDYQGSPNWEHRQSLLAEPKQHSKILETLRSIDKATLRRNGYAFEYMQQAMSRRSTELYVR